MLRAEAQQVTWYEFACQYVDLKWPVSAATTRRTNAEALTAATPGMFTNTRGRPNDKLIRHALTRWAFNTGKRDRPDCPEEIKQALLWVCRNTRPASDLADPTVLRPILHELTLKLDGKPLAVSVASRRRKILTAAIGYAIERGLLTENPIPALKIKNIKTTVQIDKRSVANPMQVRTLLAAARSRGRVGRRMAAFYGCLCYAAMRPEEAVALAKDTLADIPKQGWGEFVLDDANPHAGREWTDSGENRDDRPLKQRDRGTVRSVPCPPRSPS
jgi:hypothetical protein